MNKSAEKRRRTIRLQGWDYSQEGVYFITVCSQNREYLFGEVIDGSMNLNAPGEMIIQTWEELPKRFPFMEINTRMIMPNHFHAIVIIARRGESCIRPSEAPPENLIYLDQSRHQDQGEHKVRPYGTKDTSIGRIVQAFKSTTTHKYIRGVKEWSWTPFSGKLWQRNYYEHIVRGEEEWQRISDYIAANPINWAIDRENREATKTRQAEPWQV
jgi:putative transposase